MQNSKRSEKLCLQLSVLFSFDIFAIQPNFIIRDIAFKLDAFIICPFLKFLSMIEVFFELKVRFDVFFKRYPRVVAIVQLEKYMAKACIFGVVICKLSY